jgi:hypothetical protein
MPPWRQVIDWSRRQQVDWFERLFAFDPDGGNGTLELLLMAVTAAAVTIWAISRIVRARFIMRNEKKA